MTGSAGPGYPETSDRRSSAPAPPEVNDGARRRHIEGESMANIKSQIKRNRQNDKARARNKAVRSEIRTATKTAEGSLGTDNSSEDVLKAVRRIDKAAQKGVIHKNAAARKKSRLMRKANAAG